MAVMAESDELHARAQAFIEASLRGAPHEPFDALAAAIARFQMERVPAVARLAAARGIRASAIARESDIPAVPCDAFRLARIAAHPPEEDARLFRTSGTSQGAGARGEHPLRTTATYELGAIGWGRRMLWPDRDRLRSIVLAPPLAEAEDSSLGFMMDRFAEVLGGPATFCVRGGALDLDAAAEAAASAREANEPVIVLGASFAYVHLLEGRGAMDLSLPRGSRAMQTGGFKGRSREVEPAELRRMIAEALAIPEAHIVGEYGMTELSSQAYEGSLAAALGAPPSEGDARDGRHGVYLAPPWVRVTAVDPASLLPVPAGSVGIGRIADLANIDSAVVIQTSDRVRVTSAGIELLGRAPGAVPRGCSLAIDEMLGEGRG